MFILRAAEARGHAFHGWLDTYHSFSFADYYDPKHMGVSVLRVINDDTVAPGAGFGTHGHRDMEIISYVLSGSLEHHDSMGNGSVIRAGEVQRMSAGSGVTHSEFNASDQALVNFLQIWIRPNRRGIKPDYEQKNFTAAMKDKLCLVVSPDGANGSIAINQDVSIYAARLSSGKSVTHIPNKDRIVYVHVAKGEAEVNGEAMKHGDGATIKDVGEVKIATRQTAEVLLFDLP